MTRYIVNASTKEIHDGRTLDERCNVDDIKEKSKKRVGKRELVLLLREGFDLCDHCSSDGGGG